MNSDIKNRISFIGSGSPGGKGAGLIEIQSLINELFPEGSIYGISVGVPEMTIILSDVFGFFISENNLTPCLIKNITDEQLSLIFCRASFPSFLTGEIRKISNRIKGPLAVRSSSLTEDSLGSPLAGLFATKMIPNNDPDPDVRFRQLMNAVKYVYSSAWFRTAQDSFRAAGIDINMEKMAVIIQRVHGRKRGRYFYPAFSGVGRSFNYYPFGGSLSENGIVELAAGLGKTIVDGGRKWLYSPENPAAPPPASMKDLLDSGQTDFWAIDLVPPEKDSPLDEKEFLSLQSLKRLEQDNLIGDICSTYSAVSDRLEMGFRKSGFKLLDFSPVLRGGVFNFNDLVSDILQSFRRKLGSEIEIEFAVDFESGPEKKADFAFLQLRPMKGLDSGSIPDITAVDKEKLIAYTDNALGNIFIDDIEDLVFISPSDFSAMRTSELPSEIEKINRDIVEQGKSYILCGFGRWGTSDPSLGIPVKWSQISGASVIVESTLPDMNPDPSQGSHFFHNILNTNTVYLSIDSHGSPGGNFLDFDCLEEQEIIYRGRFFRHIKFEKGIKIIADGRKRTGIIFL